MEESDIIEALSAFISTKFPKECPCCGRRYETFADYLRNTEHLGEPISFDADEGDWEPRKPLGTLSMANCACGTTLAIDASGLRLPLLWRMMRWARRETSARGVTTSVLLSDLRERIDAAVLGEDDAGDA